MGPSPGALAEAEATLAPVLALLCWIPGNLEISAWIGRLCGGSTVSQSPSGTPQPASTLVAAGTPHRLWAWLSRQEHQLQPQGLQSHQNKSPKAEGFVHLCHALEILWRQPLPRFPMPGSLPSLTVGVCLLTTARGGNLHHLPAPLQRHAQPGSSPACGTPG